ncbi:MAG: GNAT family N-acetyltransferase [Nocardioidaceae bacterium]
MSEVKLRPADPDDADTLSGLALRSKGHWGYDQQFLEACREELTVSPARCDGQNVYVAEREGDLVGFFELGGKPPAGTLDKLYVAPCAIGSGVGTVLLASARRIALGAGFEWLTIDADPNAKGFYARSGARLVGSTESGSIAGRQLPQLLWNTREG